METISVLIKIEPYLFIKVSPAGPPIGKTALAGLWRLAGRRTRSHFAGQRFLTQVTPARGGPWLPGWQARAVSPSRRSSNEPEFVILPPAWPG